MESPDLPPPSKKAKLSPAPTNELPDSLLVKIFGYLPLKDRHQLCLVSSTWAAASRIPWSDVTFLDLSTIPRAMVDSILRLCPMLQELHAKGLTVKLEQQPNLHSSGNFTDALEGMPSGQRPSLHIPAVLAVSLPRLVLTDHSVRLSLLNQSLRGLQNLECLYLEYCTDFAEELSDLPNLRELCLVDTGAQFGTSTLHPPIVRKMPKLEVFVFASRRTINAGSFTSTIESNVALRILVVAGANAENSLEYRIGVLERSYYGVAHESHRLPITVNVPAREYPSAKDHSTHVPPLQIFVGGDISKYFRFTTPPLDMANFWRIDCPMPEYLVEPEVAEVFKDVWLAKVIRKGPENGLKPWGHPNDTELFYSAWWPLLFC